MEKEVLTLAEAAKLLRVTPEALNRELERGTVPGRRINGDRRFRRTALLDWLGERETKNGQGVEQEHPLARFAGIFKDDPVFAEAMAHIEAESERQRQEAIREADALRKTKRSTQSPKNRKQRKAA